jgi:hypothetical protein
LLAKAEQAATEATNTYLDPLDRTQRRQLGELLITLMTPKMPWLEDR